MNKHVWIAFVMAPVLGLFGYVAADRYAAGKARPATAPAAPATPAVPVTRIEDFGRCAQLAEPCVLLHGDLRLQLQARRDDDGYATFKLTSSQPIAGAVMSLWRELVDEKPRRFEPSHPENTWLTELSLLDHVGQKPPSGLSEYKFRLVVQTDQPLYAEFSTLF